MNLVYLLRIIPRPGRRPRSRTRSTLVMRTSRARQPAAAGEADHRVPGRHAAREGGARPHHLPEGLREHAPAAGDRGLPAGGARDAARPHLRRARPLRHAAGLAPLDRPRAEGRGAAGQPVPPPRGGRPLRLLVEQPRPGRAVIAALRAELPRRALLGFDGAQGRGQGAVRSSRRSPARRCPRCGRCSRRSSTSYADGKLGEAATKALQALATVGKPPAPPAALRRPRAVRPAEPPADARTSRSSRGCSRLMNRDGPDRRPR